VRLASAGAARIVRRALRGRSLREDEVMSPTLLVVDVQIGFLNQFTRHIPPRIAHLVESGAFTPLLFTRFINVADGPYPRFLGWRACAGPPETDLAPELTRWATADRVFAKPGYAGISDELAAHLTELAPDEVTIVGIDTDMCVLKVALDVFDLGIKPVILVDCCASTAGLQAHLAGLAVLARNIGADQLRDAGLGEGYLGAPP
jgi:nicotinamidase-related amidase